MSDTQSGTKNLSDEEYQLACKMYQSGSHSLVDLATQFGVTRQNLSKRFKTDGIIRGAANQVDETSFAHNRAAWIETTRVNGYKSLEQARALTRKIVADALNNKKPLATVDEDLKAAQRFNKTLVDNISASLELLDADSFISEDELPSLDIQELTDEDILGHHKSIGAVPEDTTLEELLEERKEVLGELAENS